MYPSPELEIRCQYAIFIGDSDVLLVNVNEGKDFDEFERGQSFNFILSALAGNFLLLSVWIQRVSMTLTIEVYQINFKN